MGRNWGIVAGHPLATQAGVRILEAGGNAVDAGVAAGLTLGVVHNDMVSLAGVAPIMIALAGTGEVITIDGVGTWPKRATIELFQREWQEIPAGILRTVIPAAPDAWLTALERWGTLPFSVVAAPAFELARDGFPVSELTEMFLRETADEIMQWAENSALYLPDGRPLQAGHIFKQPELAWTLDQMLHAAARAGGRQEGIAAARDAFYRGEIAQRIIAYHEERGGLLTAEDLAGFRVRIEPPVSTDFHGHRVYCCGFWSQGPVLAHTLSLLANEDLKSLGHNSAAYINNIAEALEVSFADRELYGDPAMVAIPPHLLEFANASRNRPSAPSEPGGDEVDPRRSTFHDTSNVCVIDREGNCFSATPSDTVADGPVIPSCGFVVSPRGCQSWLDPAHPSALAPGKRPRMTPNPAIVMKDGRGFMPLSAAGADVQCQAMLQVLLNLLVFGHSPQEAVEKPRFGSFGFPNSFWPHKRFPTRVYLESRISRDVAAELMSHGRNVDWWDDWAWTAGGVCALTLDGGIRRTAADPRRGASGAAW